VCTDEDLEKLDSDEMQPKPVEMNHLMELERKMHDKYNEEITVCAVCDQFCRFPSDGKYFRPVEVPSEFFELLQTPDGTGENFEKPLHPQLIAQYDVSTKFPEWTQFRGVLLSQQVYLPKVWMFSLFESWFSSKIFNTKRKLHREATKGGTYSININRYLFYFKNDFFKYF